MNRSSSAGTDAVRVAVTRLLSLGIGLAALLAASPAASFTITSRMQQAEARDASGRLTVEASIIHTVSCNTPGENGRGFYLYQYTKRLGFRAIQPPHFASPIGGRDFATFNEAAAVACGTAAAQGPVTPPIASAGGPLTGNWTSASGVVYQITQNGNAFSWYSPQLAETASGTLQGDVINVSWKGKNGTGSTAGLIYKNASGYIYQIYFNNGATFKR